ncbi:MAG TPA: Fur family transcriptional regulator [Acidimicrobiia bacterium]|nr:Fur family transcriptional regulator [Acidimicrobiia bacterium]
MTLTDRGGDLHGAAAARLGDDGQRYTRNRRALVEVLAATSRPLTLPEILERRHDVPQSSAYRNLAVLEATGVVRRVLSQDEFSRYELAEEFTDDHHHHVMCSHCGHMEDVAVPDELEAELERVAEDLARRLDYSLDHHRLDVIGTCADCRRR